MERCNNTQSVAEILNDLLLLINLKVSNIDLFEYVDSQEREKQYSLFGMILYYKFHYLCVFYEKGQWLLYDDHMFYIMRHWNELIDKIKQNFYMPIVLYYKEDARPNANFVKENNLEVTLNHQQLTNEISINSQNSSFDKATHQESKSIKEKRYYYINQSNQKEIPRKLSVDKPKLNKENNNSGKKEIVSIGNNKITNSDCNNIGKKRVLSSFFSEINTIDKRVCNLTISDSKTNQDNYYQKELLNEVKQNKFNNNKITSSFNNKIKEVNNKTSIKNENVSILDCKQFENNLSISNNTFVNNHALIDSIQTEKRIKLPTVKNKKTTKHVFNQNEWQCKKCNILNFKEKYCCINCFNINLELYLNLKNTNCIPLAIKSNQDETANQPKQTEKSKSINKEYEVFPDPNQEEPINYLPHKTQLLLTNLTNKSNKNDKANIIAQKEFGSSKTIRFDLKNKAKSEHFKKKICLNCEGTSFYETKCTNCGTEFLP